MSVKKVIVYNLSHHVEQMPKFNLYDYVLVNFETELKGYDVKVTGSYYAVITGIYVNLVNRKVNNEIVQVPIYKYTARLISQLNTGYPKEIEFDEIDADISDKPFDINKINEENNEQN